MIKILSLFDGMSVAQQAIKNIRIKNYTYYASEIDEYAIAVTHSNFPETIQLGNVQSLAVDFVSKLADIDLLIGGSPCQDLSIAKKNREGLRGQRSGLFYEYVRIRDEVKPKYFILENVASMPKEAKEQISEILGVEPVMINASLVSAQNRKRLFWVGKWNGEKYEQVEIPQPKDRGILLKDILESDVDEKYILNESALKTLNRTSYGAKGHIAELEGKTNTLTSSMGGGGGNGVYTTIKIKGLCGLDEKSKAMTATMWKGYGNDGVTTVIEENKVVRKLTPTECLRLQSMPNDYFDKAEYKGKPISNTQRYKMCGNAFNCEVIMHILKHLDL